jgi:hypothetical protein
VPHLPITVRSAGCLRQRSAIHGQQRLIVLGWQLPAATAKASRVVHAFRRICPGLAWWRSVSELYEMISTSGIPRMTGSRVFVLSADADRHSPVRTHGQAGRAGLEP